MTNSSFKLRIFLFLIGMTSIYPSAAQNTNFNNLLDSAKWQNLFPRRAGIQEDHNQGYTDDFYSFNNFKQALEDMSDYLVTIRTKNNNGIWISVKKKSTNITYDYFGNESSWNTADGESFEMEVDFQDFINRNDSVNNKRELSAFLANISKETTGGWQYPVDSSALYGAYCNWGLYYVKELGYDSMDKGAYSDASVDYPAVDTVGYYGRGPIQLSWNYNYGQFSKFLFNDKNILLENPDTIAQDGVLAFKSAIWFWMMPQCPKPSCHQVMHNLWQPKEDTYIAGKMYKKGFAHTNNIINGGLECRHTSTPEFSLKVELRSQLYKYYLAILGLSDSQIALEDTYDYTTICNDFDSSAMEAYQNCSLDEIATDIDLKSINLNIFPNPVSDQINISFENSGNYSLTIFNISGQKVFSQININNNISIDASILNSGLYILRVFDNVSNYSLYNKRILIL